MISRVTGKWALIHMYMYKYMYSSNTHRQKNIIITICTCTRKQGSDGTYGVILRIVKAGCHPVAIAQVVEHC